MIPYHGMVNKEFLLGNRVFFVCETPEEASSLIEKLKSIGFEWGSTITGSETAAALKNGILCRRMYMRSGVADEALYDNTFSCRAYQFDEPRRAADINPVSTTFNELSAKVDAQAQEIHDLKNICRQQLVMLERIYNDHYHHRGFSMEGK